MTNYPAYSFISSITNQKDAIVTMTADHDLTVGEIVSFRVTKDFGIPEINQKRSKVTAVTSDTITTEIDTSSWGTFSLANLDTAGTTPPVCVPCCSGVIDSAHLSRYNLQDAFDVRS